MPETAHSTRFQRQRPGASSGFTLIEALIAVTILMLALLGFLELIVAAQKTSQKGDHYAIAGHAASDRIAQFQATNFASLKNGTSRFSLSSLPNGSMTVTVATPAFAGGATHVKQIDVSVTWNGAGTTMPSAGAVAMSTLLSETR